MGQNAIIIGGGIIGLSIGWQLARRGFGNVSILDSSSLGKEASWTAGGMLAPISELHPHKENLFAYGKKSLSLYPKFLDELYKDTGKTIHLDKKGALLVGLYRDDIEELRNIFSIHQKLNLNTSWLTSEELRDKEPLLTPKILGGIYILEDAQINNREVIEALKRAFIHHGGIAREKTRVSSIIERKGRAIGVKTSNGEEILADIVIIAAGAWSKNFYDIPIRPVKGQLVILRMNNSLSYMLKTPRIYLAPKQNKTIKIGSTTEEVEFSKDPTAGGILYLLQNAINTVPSIYDYTLLETTVNLRPTSQDLNPTVGKGPIQGVYLATGHYRNGILFAPLTSYSLTEMILKKG